MMGWITRQRYTDLCNTVKHLVGYTVNSVLHKLGYEIVRLSGSVYWRTSLARIAARNIEVQTVIDVGASTGQWSQGLQMFYPHAYYLLIEANRAHEPALQAFKARHCNIDYVLAAAGDAIGHVYFDATRPFGGLASHGPLQGDKETVIRVPVTTIDAEVNVRKLKPPYLLKLDTHGFEVEILEGAKETLKQSSVIFIETYNFRLTENTLRFHEMCTFLESRGFRPFGLSDPLFRPKDGALWQIDLIFAQANREEFQSNSYD